MYRKLLLSSNVMTNVSYHSVKLIKKGEQLNSLDFMFPSILYAEAVPKVFLTSDITNFSMSSHLSFSPEPLRLFGKCGPGRSERGLAVANVMVNITVSTQVVSDSCMS